MEFAVMAKFHETGFLLMFEMEAPPILHLPLYLKDKSRVSMAMVGRSPVDTKPRLRRGTLDEAPRRPRLIPFLKQAQRGGKSVHPSVICNSRPGYNTTSAAKMIYSSNPGILTRPGLGHPRIREARTPARPWLVSTSSRQPAMEGVELAGFRTCPVPNLVKLAS